MSVDNRKVSLVFSDSKNYPTKVPFDPPERYPEYTGESIDPDNHIYAMVREILYRLGMDKENFNTDKWNPFKEIIRPGMTVFIKPNTVTHEHDEGKDIYSVIIHASVVRPIFDYVSKAMQNEGRIIVGDSQLYYCDFDKAMEISKLRPLIEWYSGQTKIPFECFDLRTNKAYRTYLYGRWGRKPVEQDPRGYRFVDLADKSAFVGIDPKKLRQEISSYKEMEKHHSNGKHEYLFPKSVLESDVIISIPKLKTHRRTAITLALKNFMGIPAWKDTLPHFMVGSPEEGGDQYPNKCFRKNIVTFLHDQIQTNPLIPVKAICATTKRILWESQHAVPFKDDIYAAMWYGNDTLWRTLQDLNKGVVYADREGKLQDTPQRKVFVIIDGIIGGAKDGPLAPDPVASKVLLAGYNTVAIDAVAATLMGHNPDKIPLIKKIMDGRTDPLPLYTGTKDDIVVVDGDNQYPLSELPNHHNLRFEPHPGWKGYVELP